MVAPTSTPVGPSLGDVYRFSVEDYERLVGCGVLDEDAPIELLDGVIIRKMPKGPRHSKCLIRCRRHLERLIPGDGFHVRTETPVRLPEFSEPEPDVSVARGDDERYTDRHPGPSDVVLIVEIAEASLARDRVAKRDVYARAGIPNYWVVNLVDRRVEVYSDPKDAAYSTTSVAGETDSVDLVVDGEVWGRVEVSAILP
jgi:Uma2 family endonuclease